MTDLTYIAICYNSGQVIERELGSLLQSPDRFLVVDNASTDGSADALAELGDQIELIRSPANLGYGRGANLALSLVTTKYALLLNPDLRIEESQVQALVTKAKQYPNAAVVAPATDPSHQTLGDGPVNRSFICGACMLFDMSKLQEVGLFDDNIFLFSEEKDLCKRFSDAGYDLLLFPEIHAHHIQGSSSGTSPALSYMKDWHFSWSASYYNHKHDRDKGKRSLRRRAFVYWYKALIATDRKKRAKYQARLAGALAFQRGESAFETGGNPQMEVESTQNPYSTKQTEH